MEAQAKGASFELTVKTEDWFYAQALIHTGAETVRDSRTVLCYVEFFETLRQCYKLLSKK